MGIKRYTSIFIAISLSFILCNQIRKKDDEWTFQKYVKSLPIIKFPLVVSCDSNLNPIKTSIPDSIIRKYGIIDPYVYGKCNTTQNYVAIIYLPAADYYVPIIKTTDLYGNKIDQLTLLKNCIGDSEPCYQGNSWAEITSELKIILIDTTKKCLLDTIDEIIPGSERIETETRKFLINVDGKFIELR